MRSTPAILHDSSVSDALVLTGHTQRVKPFEVNGYGIVGSGEFSLDAPHPLSVTKDLKQDVVAVNVGLRAVHGHLGVGRNIPQSL